MSWITRLVTIIAPNKGVVGPYPAPAGYAWGYVTDNGNYVTDNGQMVVSLVRLG